LAVLHQLINWLKNPTVTPTVAYMSTVQMKSRRAFNMMLKPSSSRQFLMLSPYMLFATGAMGTIRWRSLSMVVNL
jgi:hypothetical protein